MAPSPLSLIVPVYNRPQEVYELLASLRAQTDPDFEVVVVEDGSEETAEAAVRRHEAALDVRYLTKPNGGPGPARNHGAAHAEGDMLVFLDSDCLAPPGYVAAVRRALAERGFEAWGGPDRAHPDFTPTQKAISYAMTAFLTTGGIRGGAERLDAFQPRSFNMGIAREAFEALGGFAAMRFGEDVDFSLRLRAAGCRTGLVPEAWVYHKRRTTLRSFFRQVHNSGIARINLLKRHPGSLKPVHALPALAVLGGPALLVLGLAVHPVWLAPLGGWAGLIFADALRQERSLGVAALAVAASAVQVAGYGTGFWRGVWRRLVLRCGEFAAFERTFYD